MRRRTGWIGFKFLESDRPGRVFAALFFLNFSGGPDLSFAQLGLERGLLLRRASTVLDGVCRGISGLSLSGSEVGVFRLDYR